MLIKEVSENKKEFLDLLLIADEKVGKLLKDQLFSKPSAASCFVLGASSNGNEEWKRDGIKLGEIIKRENK